MLNAAVIVSPRPQRHSSSFAAIINWKGPVPVKELTSGALPHKDYAYMGHGGLYEQRVRAGCRVTAKRVADYQYAKATRSQSLANQAPPWPPAPKVFTTNGQTVQKATLAGHDRVLGPMLPPRSCSGGASGASRKPVPNTDKPLPAIPQGEARAPCAAAREDAPLTSDREVSTSGSEYSQESAQDEDEAVTPPVDLGDLSLAELGRQWYEMFGKEVGAGPLPPPTPPSLPLPRLDSPPRPPRLVSPVPPPPSTPTLPRVLPRVSTPYPPRVLHPFPPRGPAHYPSRVPPGAWATVGGPAPNVTWLPQAAVRGERLASRPGDVGEGVRYTGGHRANPWALLPDEEVRW